MFFTDEFSYNEKHLEEFEEYVELISTWKKIREIRKNIIDGKIFDATTLAAWSLYREQVNYAK